MVYGASLAKLNFILSQRMIDQMNLDSPQRVHFIIVNFNAGAWLARAISSIIEYGFVEDYQITVVDNASVDDSMRMAQNACDSDKINWVFNNTNLGFAAANNQVLAGLEADFAVLMNPDCELTDGAIEAMLGAFTVNEQYGLASGRILNEDHSLQATCRRRFPTPWTALVRMLMLDKLFPNTSKFANFDYGSQIDSSEENQIVEAISGAFMVARKVAIDEVGLLDEGYFMHCEDLDWCKRFDLAGWQVGFVPASKVIHAKGVSSESRPIKVLWTLHLGMNRFFNKFYRSTYSWPIRYAVKLGIGASFLVRAGKTMLVSVFKSG